MPDPATRYREAGWVVLPADDRSRAWVAHALPAARAAVDAPENAHWLRCEGTWFAGVNILPNDERGRIGDGPPLDGPAMDLLRELGLGSLPLDRAQVSVVHPGYPRPREGESAAAFRYRRDRDAAHVDGLLAVGADRRRMAKESHAYILGLPLTETGPGAGPLVVWEGSHRLMAEAFGAALGPHPPQDWPDVDLTDVYHAARRRAFETCRRVPVHARPGEAYLVHPLALHGMAPWEPGAEAPPEGRMIAYFRPAPASARISLRL